MESKTKLVDITHVGVANNPHPGETEYPFAHIDTRALRGKTVIGRDGRKVGKIALVQLDHHTGRTDFFEVRRGGFLGYGTEWFLEPISRIAQVGPHSVMLG